MAKKKRSDRSRLASARRLSKYAPSLKKYANRKTLTPQEKGAITRKENLIRASGGTANLRALTKNQLSVISKASRIGGGVQAAQFDNVGPRAKIRREGKSLRITQRGRRWTYQGVEGEEPPYRETAAEIFEKYPNATVYLWTTKGRSGAGASNLQDWEEFVGKKLSTYFDAQGDQWMNGLVYYV